MKKILFLQKINAMKKLLVFLLVLAVLALIMKATVPSPEKHHEIAKVKLKELFKEKISTWDGIVELIEGDRMEEHMFLEFDTKGLKMKDYFVCNAGFLSYKGKDYMLTLGMFNHVFVMTDYVDEIKKVSEKVEEVKEEFE